MAADTTPIALPSGYPAPAMPAPSPGGGGGTVGFGFDLGKKSTGFNSLSEGIKDGIPAEYRLDTKHEKNHGLYLMPVGGGLEGSTGGEPEDDPLAKAQLIQLHAPYGQKTTDWTVERWAGSNGGKPSLPPLPIAKKDSDDEGCLMENVTVVAPQPGQGSTRLYRISGQAWYGMPSGKASGDELEMGYNPHDGTGSTFDQNVIGAGGPVWTHGIVHSNSGGGSVPPPGGNE